MSDRGWIEFRRTVVPGDVLTTAYVIPDGIDPRRFDTVPETVTVQPVGRADLEDAGALLRRSDGGIEPAIRIDERSRESRDDRNTATTAEASSNAPEVLVAIPTYNEEGSIAAVVRAAKAHADAVLVVDDGSVDDTAARARAAGAEVRIHERNGGYGRALETAFEEARRRGVDHLVTLDGDGQHDSADVPRLVDRQRTEGAEIVIGSRFVDGRRSSVPLYRRLGLRAINVLANVSFGTASSRLRISDTQSGFRAYDRQAIDTLTGDGAIGTGMNASLDILYHACRHGYAIEEVGTMVRYDVESPSTYNPLSHGLGLVSGLLAIGKREHPIAVLGMPGFLSAFVGLGFAYWTVVNYVQSEVFSLGLALVSTVFMLIGLLACFTAIVLYSFNTCVATRTRGRSLPK